MLCNRLSVAIVLCGLWLASGGVATGQVAQPPAEPAAGPPTDRVDLDVTFISRTPRYPSLHGKVGYVDLHEPFLKDPNDAKVEQFFPEAGERVTFTAHFMNKGKPHRGEVAAVWKIDGRVVERTRVAVPAPGEVGTAEYQWTWETGPHEVTFALDPDDTLGDFATVNNSKTDRTDALGFLFFCTREVYEQWEQQPNMVGTYSFEDYMNWHFDEMNRQFADAVYPAAPEGCLERVRVDYFAVIDDDADRAAVDHFGYSGFWTFAGNSMGPGEPDPGLIHELGHQLGLIDQYAIVLPLFHNRLEDRHGDPAMRGYLFHQVESNMFGPGAMKWSELSSAALNRQKGYPRGYFGTYLFDHAPAYAIRVLDQNGAPLAGAKVTYYRFSGGPQRLQDGTTDARGLLALDNVAMERAEIPHSPFEVRPSPFGEINILGNGSVLCFHVRANEQEDFAMSGALWFLVNAWRADADTSPVVVDIPTTIGPADGPPPPRDVRAEWAPDLKIRVTWAPGDDDVRYHVYRSHLVYAWSPEMSTPERVGEAIDGTECTFSAAGDAMRIYVTAVDAEGREGGASRWSWVPFPIRDNQPAGLAYDAKHDRVIIAAAERVNALSAERGFWPISPWVLAPRGVTITRDGHALTAIHGDGSVRLWDLDAPTPEREITTYGHGGEQERLNKPRDVAVDGRGTVVVADTGNDRVVVISQAGEWITTLDGGEAGFTAPTAVTVLPDGRIVVGCEQADALRVATIGDDGTATYQALPLAVEDVTDLVVTAAGELLVVDGGRGDVRLLVAPAYEGARVLKDGLERPTSAAIGRDGVLWVYDAGRRGMAAFVQVDDALDRGATAFLVGASDAAAEACTVIPEKLYARYAPVVDVADWWIVGPFDNAGGEGYDRVYGPERAAGVDPQQSFDGVRGQVRWQPMPTKACPDGRLINFDRLFTPSDYVCAYAATTLHTDEAQTVRLLTGSDDTITVWVNGEEVLGVNRPRAANPDEDRTDVELRAGTNRILVKVCDGMGGWAFYFRVADPETGEMPAGVKFERPGAGH